MNFIVSHSQIHHYFSFNFRTLPDGTMINRNRIYHNHHHVFNSIRKSFSASPLVLSDAPTITPCEKDHKSLCFSLVENLLNRGLLSAAQRVVQRIVLQSNTITDEISIIDFAVSSGVEPELPCYSALITRLVNVGEFNLAENLYIDRILKRGLKLNASLLTSMMICYCKLGKIKEENDHVEKLLVLKSSYSSVSTFSKFLVEVFEQNRLSDAYKYCVRINDAGILLPVSCYGMLISGLSSRGYVDEALHVFDIMLERGVQPACHLWNSLIFGFCKIGRVEKAELLSTEMESHGFLVDKVMYTSLINGYCKNRKVKMGMRLFYKMLKMGCQPDTYTYNTVMRGIVNSGFFDKIWVLHRHMSDLGLEPDVLTYQIMIEKFCKENKVDFALTMLSSMGGRDLIPNVRCYTSIIPALYKERRADVDEVYQKMLDSGVIPDQVLFFKLLKEYPKGHELHLTLMFLNAIAKYGCGIDPLQSSVSFGATESIQYQIDHILGQIVERCPHFANMAYSIYIIGLCVGGKCDDALRTTVFMINLGFQPLISAYNSLIKCFCQEGFVEHSGALIELMEGMGMIPNSTTFLVMIYEHCKHNNLVSAFDVLRLMHDRRLKPTVAIYDCVIRCLGREKSVYDAHGLFKKLLESGVEPDDALYLKMINVYVKYGQAIKAEQLFNRMMRRGIQPNLCGYSSLVSGFVKKNMMEKGVLYLESMLKDGFIPNKVLYTSLIDHFLRKGDLEFACRLISLMERSHIECDQITYITLICGLCRNLRFYNSKWHDTHNESQKERDRLYDLLSQNSSFMQNDTKISITTQEDLKLLTMKLIRGIKDSFYMPNLYLYNTLLSGYCRMGKFEGAYELLDAMVKQGVGPNQVTFTILVNGHIQVGEIDVAIGLFNRMNADGCFPDRILYNILIKGLCKNKRLLDALSLSHVMCKRGFVPSEISYEYMLVSLCASRLVDEALNIFEDMISHNYFPCRYNCSWLLHMLHEENKFYEAQMVRDLMLKRKKVINETKNLMGS